MIRRILSDFNGLRRTCGLGVALRWLAQIALHFPQCVRTRTLMSADRSMGQGPFTARYDGAKAKIPSDWAIALIREIWVRDVYLNRGFIRIPPGATVLDLGANRGAFTALALAMHPDVHVICVEPRDEDCQHLRHMLRINGWLDRAQICTAFVGGKTAAQDEMLAAEPDQQAEFISEQELIDRYSLTHLDLIKCDIEGSEFELITPQSRLLAMADQIAIEVHADPERCRRFQEMLTGLGFEVIIHSEHPLNTIMNARRQRPVAAG